MLTVFSLREANSSMNVTQTQSKSNSIIRRKTFLLKNSASLACGRRENFIDDDNTVGTRLVPESHESGSRSSSSLPRRSSMFSSFSKCVKSLSNRNSRDCSARNGTAEAGEKMQLSEHAGEGGLAALVRAGYHKNALLAFQVKIIADDRRLLRMSFWARARSNPS